MLALSVWGWGWVTAEISSDVNSFDFSAYYTLFLLLTSLGGKTVRWSAGFKKERRGPRVGQCTGPSRRPGELLEQRAPEGWALGYRSVLEQCLERWSLQDAHTGSDREGWHSVGVTHMEWQRQSITGSSLSQKPVPLHHLEGGGRKGWMGSEGVLSLVLVSHCSSLLLIGSRLY